MYLAKVIGITENFQEFWRIVIQENSKFSNFEYEVIQRTPIRQVMAITDFFQEILRIVFQENSKISNFEYKVIWRTSISTK
jgi:hypothetical protein